MNNLSELKVQTEKPREFEARERTYSYSTKFGPVRTSLYSLPCSNYPQIYPYRAFRLYGRMGYVLCPTMLVTQRYIHTYIQSYMLQLHP